MLVSNGADISPPQTGVIAIANNNVDYDETIQNKLVDSIVSDESINGNLVVIKLVSGRNREINLADVTNQAGWTNDSAGLIQAIEDINGWITSGGSSYDGNPNVITQDATHRFATDAEKTTWDSKETGGAAAAALTSANSYTDTEVSDLASAVSTALNGKADSLGPDDNYVTDAEKTKLANTSGTNTGDQDLSGKLNVPTGTPDGTKYLRDDNTWQPIIGGSGLAQFQVRQLIRR